jgi:hypothetical protein
MVVSVLGGLLPLATAIQAQTNSFPSAINVPAFPDALPHHVPSIRPGPVDLSKYSSDVLNCAICRERLGLPALAPSTAKANKIELPRSSVSNPTQKFPTQPPQVDRPATENDLPSQVGTAFGGPGVITAGTAKQLEAPGFIIQELRPPTPNPDEVKKEETLQPANATKEAPIAPESSNTLAETTRIAEQMKAENSKLAEQLATAAKEREKLQEMMQVQAESFEKKIAEIERSNQETAKMLEVRTLEITELQNQLQAKPKSQKRSKAVSGNAKKKPSKNASKDH